VVGAGLPKAASSEPAPTLLPWLKSQLFLGLFPSIVNIHTPKGSFCTHHKQFESLKKRVKNIMPIKRFIVTKSAHQIKK
jgi:hypothetical protein